MGCIVDSWFQNAASWGVTVYIGSGLKSDAVVTRSQFGEVYLFLLDDVRLYVSGVEMHGLHIDESVEHGRSYMIGDKA